MPSGFASKPPGKALDVAASATPAPARKSNRKARNSAPQVSAKSKRGTRPSTSPVTYPATAPRVEIPTEAMIEGEQSETTPFSGAKPLKNRAKVLPVPRPPAQMRVIPAAQFPDEQGQALILARYQQLLASMAGAFGLYLHGAATLPHPSIEDLTNLEEFTAMIRGFGLPSVGFE